MGEERGEGVIVAPAIAFIFVFVFFIVFIWFWFWFFGHNIATHWTRKSIVCRVLH
jgi:hypothetical protein